MQFESCFETSLDSRIAIYNFVSTSRGGGGGVTCICCDTGMCHYFGYFFGGCSRIFGNLFGLFPDFWVSFLAIPGFLVSFLVKFDFFQNNADFGLLILIFPSMTLWNVACRALVSMILQFSFLFYYVCAKSSTLSITAMSLSWYIVVLFDFNIILPLWIIFNALRSSQMNKVN